MNTAQNKELMQRIFTELSQGKPELFAESMAEELRWTITGQTRWSRTFAGKQAVLTQLLAPLGARMAGPVKVTAHRFIAEDDLVVVEAKGDNTTKSGIPYNNTYCFVFRLAGGKIEEVTEYLDTELVTAVLGDPGAENA